MQPIVIIGTGLAGYMTAKELRKYDTDTPLVMITDSNGHFYSKPTLSTALTHGRDAEQLITTPSVDMAKQLNAHIFIRSQVMSINRDTQQVMINGDAVACIQPNGEVIDVNAATISDGISYSKLVLACGANVYRLPLTGDAADQVMSVNNIEDYETFRQQLSTAKNITILGGGLVGSEFANDLINAGYSVTVIDPAPFPVARLLPEKVGTALQTALAEKGVQWHFGEKPIAINKADTLQVQCENGLIIDADIVLSAVGLIPNISLAQQCGLEINHAIVVDQYLRSSDNNIFALGDCAEVNGHSMFFIAPILQCARALGKTLSGEETKVRYPAMPVALKTPACPVVISAPANVDGQWQLNGEAFDWSALFHSGDQLNGFVLSGACTKERAVLQKQLPPLFE